jgi:hypothetical protein
VDVSSFVLEDLPEHAGVRAGAVCTARVLRQHLAAHGVATDAIEPLTAALGPGLHGSCYLELLISEDGATVGFLIRARDPEFTARLAAVLACCEIEPTVAARMLALAETLHPGRYSLKLTFATAGELHPEVCLIQQRPLALEPGLQLLAADAAMRDQVHTCAALLHQRSLHGIAVAARPREAQWRAAVRFVQLITSRRRETARLRLAHVASRIAPCAAAVSCWAEQHDRWLAREHALLSLWLQPGGAEAAAVRIEYPDVAVPAAGLLEPGSPEMLERFEQLSLMAGRATLSSLEVSLQQARLPRLHAAVCVRY